MNYKDSSYYRAFKLSMFTILSVLVFIGVVLITTSARVYKNAELKELKETGDLFISCLEDEYGNAKKITDSNVECLHYRFSEEEDLDIYIYDKQGECILAPSFYDASIFADNNMKLLTENTQTKKKGKIEEKPISSKIKNAIEGKKRKYLSLDATSFSKNQPSLTYGTRMYLRHEGEIAPDKLYIVISGRTDSINVFTLKMIGFYLAFSGLAMYISFLILRKKCKKQAQFEFDFLKVCEMYAKGDFSEKIRDDTNDSIPKELAGYINSLAANVENSEQTSKTFIANVSHELRTPMTTISGFVSGILDGTIPKNRQNEYLILVSKEMQRLRILISSMLNMTKFESGTMKPNFKETNLTDLVIQTVLMFEKRIDEKHLQIEGLDSERLSAVVDSDLMQQVIYNIVENAVKFVNECGTLTFTFEKNENGNVVAIRNTGEGLADDEIPQVFDRFYKTDSSRGKDATGLGLGLSISRKIVHLHKGHIVVKSVHGEYTEFQIQIPDLNEKTGERKNNEKADDEK